MTDKEWEQAYENVDKIINVGVKELTELKRRVKMKYYLVAYGGMEDYTPIGGLEDTIAYSEFSQALIDYINDSSFYSDGHIYFIESDSLYFYAICKDGEWEIFEDAIKLEDYDKLMLLG